MKHILDNPIWNALNSGNANLALGNRHAKFLPADIGPFSGMEAYNPQSFKNLYDVLPSDHIVAILAREGLPVPGYFKMTDAFPVLQMTGENLRYKAVENNAIVSLREKDVEQMIVLTGLTHPGPFLQRTIVFGNYEGIFKGDTLVAMAGQRMHPYQYREVSAVCTHPDHTGHGYAGKLIQRQVNQIISNDHIPFLHVKAENEHAIGLYKHLGFTARTLLNIYVIEKSGL